MGDFFHTRNTISVNTLHIANLFLEKLKDFTLHMILGNHDLYFHNESTVSGVNLFKNKNNIIVYDKLTKTTLGNKEVVFCGWGYDALSESTCDWNNFYGELGIRREDNKWQAWIYKIENGAPVKKIMLKEQEVSDASTEALYYVVIYMGTQDQNNMCGMAITNLQVDIIHDDNTLSGHNPAPFKSGDEVKIDCYNNKVYLNNKLYNDIDIGSQFIELLSGNNILKFASEDPNMHATVLYNERYL